MVTGRGLPEGFGQEKPGGFRPRCHLEQQCHQAYKFVCRLQQQSSDGSSVCHFGASGYSFAATDSQHQQCHHSVQCVGVSIFSFAASTADLASIANRLARAATYSYNGGVVSFQQRQQTSCLACMQWRQCWQRQRATVLTAWLAVKQLRR